MAIYSDLNGTTETAFKVAKATVSATSVVTAQTYALPATGGTFALTSDIAARPFDGGSASTTYLVTQSIDGGGASRTAARTFDGGGA